MALAERFIGFGYEVPPIDPSTKQDFNDRVSSLAKLGKKTTSPGEWAHLQNEQYEARFRLPDGRILEATHHVRQIDTFGTLQFNRATIVEIIPAGNVEVLYRRAYDSSPLGMGYTDEVYGYIGEEHEFYDYGIGYTPDVPQAVTDIEQKVTDGNNGVYKHLRDEQAKTAIGILDSVDVSTQFPPS